MNPMLASSGTLTRLWNSYVGASQVFEDWARERSQLWLLEVLALVVYDEVLYGRLDLGAPAEPGIGFINILCAGQVITFPQIPVRIVRVPGRHFGTIQVRALIFISVPFTCHFLSRKDWVILIRWLYHVILNIAFRLCFPFHYSILMLIIKLFNILLIFLYRLRAAFYKVKPILRTRTILISFRQVM